MRLGTAPGPGARQATWFGIVSIITTVLDFALFNVLFELDVMPVVAANTVSYGAGIIASYVLNKRLTFAGGGRDKRHHEVGIFVAINVVGLLLNNAAVGIAVRWIGDSALMLNLAKLAAGAATWVLKFVTFKRWVYPMREGGPALEG